MTQSPFSTLTIYFILLLVFASCKQTTKQSTATNKIDTLKNANQIINVDNKIKDSSTISNIENKIIDTIFSLKEVKDREKYVAQQTKGKRHLQVWVADTPNLENKYFWIKVGEDNGMNLVTHFNFDVYPDSMRIMYFDTVNDTVISLRDWRKINGM